MSDQKNFDRIMRGLNEVADIADGGARPARFYVPADIDVKAVRRKLGLGQEAFAARFGFSVGSVRDWEQKRNPPTGVARVLLTVIDREPEAVARALDQPAA